VLITWNSYENCSLLPSTIPERLQRRRQLKIKAYGRLRVCYTLGDSDDILYTVVIVAML